MQKEKEFRYGTDFYENVAATDALLCPGDNFDVLKREITVGGKNAVFYYVDGFIKDEVMQKLMQYFIELESFPDGMPAEKFICDHLPYVDVDTVYGTRAASVAVMSGGALMLSQYFGPAAVTVDVRSYPGRSVEEPENDRVMRGSRDGFVETLHFNTAMIRRRIRTPKLRMKHFCVGKSTKTDVVLCYIEGRADENYVEYLSARLRGADCDSISMGHQSIAETIIHRCWYNPFPKIRTTERPDNASAQILEGSVILLCDNSPEAMIFPTSIFDFLQEADDYYFPPLTGTYLRLLRHFVFWLTMVLSPLWYLAVMYPDAVPDWIAFVVPKETGEIPIIFQLFLVEIVIDGLKLASLNTPNILNNSLSIVGGLILGDFAVKTGWLIPEVILYMALIAIANFSQSSYELGYAFKFLRMFILLLTAIFGIWGFFGGIAVALILITTNETVNRKRSYLYPLIPFNGNALARLYFRLGKRNHEKRD